MSIAYPRRSTGSADLSLPGPGTYEVRWPGLARPFVALTVTVEADTRLEAIAAACGISGLPRDRIESVREV
jgi:hypothetical protein